MSGLFLVVGVAIYVGIYLIDPIQHIEAWRTLLDTWVNQEKLPYFIVKTDDRLNVVFAAPLVLALIIGWVILSLVTRPMKNICLRIPVKCPRCAGMMQCTSTTPFTYTCQHCRYVRKTKFSITGDPEKYND